MSAIVMTDRIRLLRAVVFAALCVAMAATAHVAMAGSGVSPTVLAGGFGAVLGLTWLLAGKRRGLGVISLWMVVAQTALHQLFEQAAAFSRGGGGLGRLATTDWAALLLCNPDRAPGGLSPVELARMAGIDPDVPPATGSLRPAAGTHHGGSGATAVDAGLPGMTGMPDGPHMMPDGALHGGGSYGTAQDLVSAPAQGPAHDMAHGMSHGMSPGMAAAHVLAALACALLLWRGDAALVRLFELLGALGAVVAGALLLPLLALFARPFGYRAPAPPRPADDRARPPRSVLLTHAVVRRGPPAFALAC
ncbi:hypothetical protein DR950_35690 [Kitasatospora xanthocidica]|uniref:PE-PGRS family protein n=1 Tax=Kitasatospora xanthocidica TaxID=83382 RepID=A0A373A2K4_9ACTN|nr:MULTISPECIES: hypothetical protein [Streptomycetaceae]OKI03667.1 hypothetical protein AMK13_25170 [Streptomyces sp. CB02056]RGD62383.1 hypothetical protein DR950_35690 [Kitasatospora xanthocidica]